MNAQEPPRPPSPPAPPTEALGAPVQPPTTGKWWQRAWGAAAIGTVGLLVGAGIGAAGSSTTKTVTAEGRTTTVQGTPPPARTVTVAHVVVHTHTVTQTQTAAPAEQAAVPAESSGSGSSGEAQTFSGNGGKNLGTITVEKESTLEWTNDGSVFQLYTSESVPVNSQAHSGSSVLEPGSYKSFQVNAVGNWTIKIVPK
jgi:hypothetical protein